MNQLTNKACGCHGSGEATNQLADEACGSHRSGEAANIETTGKRSKETQILPKGL